MRPTLEEFVNFPGPAFLEVMVDPNAHVYPMVGPGMGYKDMITGKWIPSRGDQSERRKKTERAGGVLLEVQSGSGFRCESLGNLAGWCPSNLALTISRS